MPGFPYKIDQKTCEGAGPWLFLDDGAENVIVANSGALRVFQYPFYGSDDRDSCLQRADVSIVEQGNGILHLRSMHPYRQRHPDDGTCRTMHVDEDDRFIDVGAHADLAYLGRTSRVTSVFDGGTTRPSPSRSAMQREGDSPRSVSSRMVQPLR